MAYVPDKSWMDIDNRFDPVYIFGIEKFLEFALANNKRLTPGYIPCLENKSAFSFVLLIGSPY